MKQKDIKRFESRFKKSAGCWVWLGGKATNGYGRYWFDGRLIPAHRFSFMLYNGKIKDGNNVCHKCDNRICINPKHLFQGTQSENIIDARNKGRLNRVNGEGHPKAKLKARDVLEIRKSNLSHIALARKYGVTNMSIIYIRQGKNWKHLTELSEGSQELEG